MAEITIDRPVEQVWNVFTDISTWRVWWGGDVKSVTPGWQAGAQVMWATGGGTSVFEFIDRKRVGLKGSYGEKVVWSFSQAPGNKTIVSMGEDLSSSGLISNSAARQAEFNDNLRKLKTLVESRYPRSSSTVPATSEPRNAISGRTRQIVIEADSLKAAKKKLNSEIPKGYHILSEEVISDGKPKIIKAVAETAEAAFAKAQEEIPQSPGVLETNLIEITDPKQRTVTIEAFDEQSAIGRIKDMLAPHEIIQSIKLVVPGTRGFLGLGKKPNQYEANVLQQAIVQIEYTAKAKISAKLGNKRSAKEGAAPQKMSSPTKMSSSKNDAACVVICELPADIAARRALLEPILNKCAQYCWNPVSRKYNFDERHIQKAIVCTDITNPSLTYLLDVPPNMAVEVINYTQATWRELMDAIRQVGIDDFLRR